MDEVLERPDAAFRNTEDLDCIVGPYCRSGRHVPFPCHHARGRKRKLQPRITFVQRIERALLFIKIGAGSEPVHESAVFAQGQRLSEMP
jgi:hypothetical protein